LASFSSSIGHRSVAPSYSLALATLCRVAVAIEAGRPMYNAFEYFRVRLCLPWRCWWPRWPLFSSTAAPQAVALRPFRRPYHPRGIAMLCEMVLHPSEYTDFIVLVCVVVRAARSLHADYWGLPSSRHRRRCWRTYRTPRGPNPQRADGRIAVCGPHRSLGWELDGISRPTWARIRAPDFVNAAWGSLFAISRRFSAAGQRCAR